MSADPKPQPVETTNVPTAFTPRNMTVPCSRCGRNVTISTEHVDEAAICVLCIDNDLD